MTDSQTPDSFGRSIPFTIDGQPFTTDDITQMASALLRLAGLDPANYNLGELEGKEQPKPKRFDDDEVVEIKKDARFVSDTSEKACGLMNHGIQEFIDDLTRLGFNPNGRCRPRHLPNCSC